MKKCTKCGVKNKNDAVVCIECGTPLDGAATSADRASAGFSGDESTEISRIDQSGNGKMIIQDSVYYQQSPQCAPGAKGKAVASLILGLTGLIISCIAPFVSGIPAILGFFLSIMGIVYAVKARNGIPVTSSGRGVATAGMIFSILGTIIGGLISLVFICIVIGIITCVCSTPTANIDYYTVSSMLILF